MMMMMMKGVFCKPKTGDELQFFVQETSVPGCLGNHQVKVQVKACGLSPVNIQLLQDLSVCRDIHPVGREISGVVLHIGPKVTFFKPDDEVVGILPLDSEQSGLCDVVLIHENQLVQKPENLSWVESAGVVQDGLRAYTALHTLARMSAGHCLLVLDGATHFGLLTIQVAHYSGVKVLATAVCAQDQLVLEQLRPGIARVISTFDGKTDLIDACLEETGGLGVDIVIDAGVRLHQEEEMTARLLPHKHDIISVLAAGGQWVTTEDKLQLDPPDSHSLFLKGASVSFLNEEVWGASSAGQGKYLHILRDVVEKLSSGSLRPLLEEPVPWYEATVSMELVQKKQVRKKLVALF